MRMKYKKTIWETYRTLREQVIRMEGISQDSLKWGRIWEYHPYTEELTYKEAEDILRGLEYLVSLEREISVGDKQLYKPTQKGFKQIIDFFGNLEEYEKETLWVYKPNKPFLAEMERLIVGYGYYRRALKNKQYTDLFPQIIYPIEDLYKEEAFKKEVFKKVGDMN